MNLPLRVYLDSADYSVLSDSARRTPEFIDILTRLIEWQEAGKVEFWFSGVHISEMAPLRGQNVGPSVRRTELLVRLCKRHAFIAFDQLIEAELRALHRRTPTETEVRSYEGDWFPELGELLPPGWLDRQYAEVLDELHSWVRAAGANREQRRRLGRVMGKRRIKHRMFSQMARNADESGVEEMVRRYAMRREAAKTIRAYLIGRATRADAESAFLDSLRDPVWMMQWFGLYPDRMAPISDWMREPAHKLTGILETLVATAKAHNSRMRVAPSRPGASVGGEFNH